MNIKAIRKSRLAFWGGLAIVLVAGGAGAGLAASSGTRQLPPPKQHLLDLQAAARAHAPHVAKTNHGPPPQAKPPPRVPGIVNTGINAGPFSPAEFKVRNMWNGPIRGLWYLVYAGAQLNPDTGAVVAGGIRIYALPIDPNASDQSLTFVGSWAAPTTQSLRISKAAASTLTLTTDSGQTFTFDLSKKTFR